MQFLTSLFGGSGNTLITVLFALGAVLVLVVLVAWLLRLLFNASAGVGRGRNKRLAVTDVLPIDSKRQLVIVRRDNVEHLMLIGGGQDIVIETGIPAELPQSRLPRRQAAAAQGTQGAHIAKRAEPASAPQPAPDVSPAEPAWSSRPLRQTGLLRPTQETEPVIVHKETVNSPLLQPDSAKRAEMDTADTPGDDEDIGGGSDFTQRRSEQP